MRYAQYVIHSRRLLLQLLLVVLLAGLIGGTGLVGLQSARTAITTTSTVAVPALMELQNAEQALGQASYYGMRSFAANAQPAQAQADLASMRAQSAASIRTFTLFAARTPLTATQRVWCTRIGQLFNQWTIVINLSRLMTPSIQRAPATMRAMNAANATIAVPLAQDIAALMRVTDANVRETGSTAISTSRLASLMLVAVIVLAVLLVSLFQLGLSVREHRRGVLAHQSAELVVLVDARGMIRYASPAYERILGGPAMAVTNTRVLDLVHPDDQAAAGKAIARRLSQPVGTQAEELRVRHADGSYRWLSLTGFNRMQDPLVKGLVITGHDITKRKAAEAALAFEATHDTLTKLPNRAHLLAYLQQTLTGHPEPGQVSALLLLDLDRFKEVNDTLGHHAGDVLLQHVGTRLLGALRTGDLVARLGGDEFAVLLPGVNGATAQDLAERLADSLAEPFPVLGQSLEIGVSIGIALYPAHGQGPHLLLQHADVAMYQAKREHVRVAVYDPENDQHSMARLALMRDLRMGLLENQLQLYYQPKIELTTNHICGVEALLRWQHPIHGWIPPDQFVPLAEQTGLIGPLTDWVLATALTQHRAWKEAGRLVPIAVNISARNLQDPQLAGRVERLLSRHGIAPENLTLEITESSLMSNPGRAKELLAGLQQRGVRISIDDFGTGYSSLAYLKDLPVHELKVDRSFVQGMDGDGETKDAAIVRSVIAMAHALELSVVAEGVEDASAQALLAGFGCDIMQGYHLSRPVPAAELAQWLDTAAPAVTPVACSLMPIRAGMSGRLSIVP